MSKHRIKEGETVRKVMPYSEVCVSMRVAGLVRKVKVLENSMAQIMGPSNEMLGGPVTTGEAGVYRDLDGYYCLEDQLAL